MTLYLDDGDVRLYAGDCLDVMREMDAESVDAVVTDPPYGIGFMGKEWDGPGRSFVERKPARRNRFDHVGGNHNPTSSADASRTRAVENARYGEWCTTWAIEALRVLKPGGHLLAFGGTRTFHRLTCAIEDAGFEVRDCLSWLYGSGFPKSLAVDKAIDRMGGDQARERERVQSIAALIAGYRERAGLTRQQVSEIVVGTPSGACWNWENGQPPAHETWPLIKAALAIPDDFDGLLLGLAVEREVLARIPRPPGWFTNGDGHDVTAPATPEAARWQGWGTALKPAWEPIVVARKPLAGTVSQTVLEHGTGAINVDGCRIEHTPGSTRNPVGRFPANVVLDEEAAGLLDEQAGERPAGAFPGRADTSSRSVFPGGFTGGRSGDRQATDTGGPSRFYYTSKASSSERDGATHPTVKPLALMRWLVRLVTPPGGLVLDPFAGSGTTLLAAREEGMRGVGIEREEEYLAMAAHRLRQLSLFGDAG